MSAATAFETPAGSMTESTAEGRNRISTRALERVATAAAADALGVDVRSVSVALSDERGSLVVTVRAPARVPSLKRLQDDRGLVTRSGGPLLERSRAAQQQIRQQAAALTGATVARVVVHLTSASIRTERRVK